MTNTILNEKETMRFLKQDVEMLRLRVAKLAQENERLKSAHRRLKDYLSQYIKYKDMGDFHEHNHLED